MKAKPLPATQSEEILVREKKRSRLFGCLKKRGFICFFSLFDAVLGLRLSDII
jgi:hypothetical protein